MNGIYDVGIDHPNKRTAIKRAIDGELVPRDGQQLLLFDKDGSGDQFRCVLLMSSKTCIDLRCLIEAGKIGSGTKLLFVDDVDGRNRLLKKKNPSEKGGCYDVTEWKETVIKILHDALSRAGQPMIPEKNIVFHNGDVLRIPLRAYLQHLGEPALDFVFFDFCGASLPDGFASFVYGNMDMFCDGCMVWVTKAIGSAVPMLLDRKDGRHSAMNELYHKCIVHKESQMLHFEQRLDLNGVKIKDKSPLMDSIKYSNFEVARCFCNTYKCESCGIYLYKGDRRKTDNNIPASNMAIFAFKKRDSDWSERRGRYFHCFIPNSGYRPVLSKEIKERIYPRLLSGKRCVSVEIDGQQWFMTTKRGRQYLVGDADIELCLQHVNYNVEEFFRRFELNKWLGLIFREDLNRSGKAADNKSNHTFNDTSRFPERIQTSFDNRRHFVFTEELCQCTIEGKHVNGILRGSPLHYELLRYLYDKVVLLDLARKFHQPPDCVDTGDYFRIRMRFRPGIDNIEFYHEGQWRKFVSEKNGELLVQLSNKVFGSKS